MHAKHRCFCTILIFLFLCLEGLQAQVQLGPRRNLFKVDEIDIKGLKKVEKEAVLEKLKIKKGMVLDNYVLRRDIENIYRLKYFEFVEAHSKKLSGKNLLLFKVKEKPIISKIIIEGNDELDEDELMGQLKSKAFSILDINTVKTDVTTLEKFYEEKGFYLAAIKYDVRKIDNENIELVFKVQEFDKVRVKQITILGNKAFSDGQLKAIMSTQEESFFSFLSGSGSFKEFNFQADIELLKYFYKTKGYLQVNIGTPEITVSEDKRWVFITFKINEGPEFTVNNISFQGEVLFPEEELLTKVQLKKNNTYSEELLRKDIQMLTEMYQDKGYAFANVLRTLQVVPGENKVDVEFSFEKGKIAYFGKITVLGNTKTRDKVIRRELKIKEGAKFSGSSLRISKENVNRLGFFEPGSVVFNTVTSKDRDDVLDVEISLKEKNTGQISMGAGYSTAQGGFFQASVSQNNFRGLGQTLSFSTTLAKTNESFSLGFTEPYFNDTKWIAGGDIFVVSDKNSRSFDEKRKGFNLRVGYPIYEFTRLFVTYKFEDTELKNVEDPTVDVDTENGLASAVRVAIEKDKRNHRFEPSRGHYLLFATEYAGLGGDKKWLKNETDLRYYKTLVGDLVLRTRLYASKLDRIDGQRIPRSEKFSLGGSRNLRGFNIEDIGPKTQVTIEGVDVEFNTRALFSTYTQIELEHPLAREAGLKWVVFFDAGDADEYDNLKIRMDYGFGLRWFSPLGVLRFEFGYPINPEEGEDGSQFHFDIGQLF